MLSNNLDQLLKDFRRIRSAIAADSIGNAIRPSEDATLVAAAVLTLGVQYAESAQARCCEGTLGGGHTPNCPTQGAHRG